MIVQIAGAILIGVSMVCGTWYAVTVKRIKNRDQARARRERLAHNERISGNGYLALYQEEEARGRDLVVRNNILTEQLKRRDKEIERLKGLLEESERRAS